LPTGLRAIQMTLVNNHAGVKRFKPIAAAARLQLYAIISRIFAVRIRLPFHGEYVMRAEVLRGDDPKPPVASRPAPRKLAISNIPLPGAISDIDFRQKDSLPKRNMRRVSSLISLETCAFFAESTLQCPQIADAGFTAALPYEN